MKDEKNNQIYTGVKIQRQPWTFLDKGGSWQIEEEMQSGDVQLSNMRGSTIKMRSANAKYEVGLMRSVFRAKPQEFWGRARILRKHVK